MDTTIELQEAKRQIEKLNNTVKELKTLIQHYEELFRLSQKRAFGRSSEKSVLAEQVNLWGIEAQADPVADEVEEIIVKRRKQKGKRAKDLRKCCLIKETRAKEPRKARDQGIA